MQEKLHEHLNKIDKILEEDKIKNKDGLLKDQLTQIQFFQHERLIHLIVTTFVGIIDIIFFITGVYTENIIFLLLFGLLLLLFIPYIIHYYHLENGVQKMYEQYWNLKNK